MKKSTIKKIMVRLTSDNIQEFNIDTDIFNNPFVEAATQAIEKTRSSKHSIIRAVMECWEKRKPKDLVTCNSYWILINASCQEKAEILREKFKMQTDCDLAEEPIYARGK